MMLEVDNHTLPLLSRCQARTVGWVELLRDETFDGSKRSVSQALGPT
jgi:hypothetical protein